MSTTELLPCPFCGDDQPALDHETDTGAWTVLCTHCGIRLNDFAGERSARSAWNRRASQSQQPAPAEAVAWIGSEDLKGRTYLPIVYLGAKAPEWPHDPGYYDVPLYAAAAAVQPPVVPHEHLNDRDIEMLAAEFIAEDWMPDRYYRDMNLVAFAHAIEAKVRGIGAGEPR